MADIVDHKLTNATATNAAYDYHPGALSKAYTANGLNQYASVAGTTFS